MAVATPRIGEGSGEERKANVQCYVDFVSFCDTFAGTR